MSEGDELIPIGKACATALQTLWRARLEEKKARRSREASPSKFEHGVTDAKQMMTNVITLFPFQNGSVATLHNEAQSSQELAEIGIDGPDWVPTIGDLSPDMPDESFPRFRRVSLNAAVELLRAIRPEYKGAADTTRGYDASGSAHPLGRTVYSAQGESV